MADKRSKTKGSHAADPGAKPAEEGLAGYARCSTDEQEAALEGQISRLRRAGARLIYQELESGRNNDRPEIMRLIRDVRKGKVKRIIVTRADRLGRDHQFVSSLIGVCERYGVPIETLDGGRISHATPQDFLMANMVTSMAEFESRMLSMRITAAFENYRLEGRPLRQRFPFGYRPKDKYKLEPHPDQWEDARRVISLLREKGSFHAVKMDMAKWCSWKPASTTLQNWFCNPILRGHIPYKKKPVLSKKARLAQETEDILSPKKRNMNLPQGWDQEWETIVYDCHPALISQEEWDELAALLRQPRNRFGGASKAGTEPKHGLTGLCKCMSCEHKLRRHIDNCKRHWWRCSHHTCTKRAGIREDELWDFVQQEAREAAAQIVNLPKSTETKEDPKLAKLREQLDQAKLLAAANPEVFGGAVKQLEIQVEMIERSAKSGPDPEVIAALGRMIAYPGFLLDAAPEEQRAILSGLLLEVRVGHVQRVRSGPRSWKQIGEIPLAAVRRSF